MAGSIYLYIFYNNYITFCKRVGSKWGALYRPELSKEIYSKNNISDILDYITDIEIKKEIIYNINILEAVTVKEIKDIISGK